MKSSKNMREKKRPLWMKRILADYQRMLRKCTDRQLIPAEIMRLLAEQRRRKEFRRLLGIFRDLPLLFKRTSEYYFTLGLVYLNEAEWLCLTGGDIRRNCTRSIKYFDKAISADPNRLEYYAQLSKPFSLLGEHTKAREIVSSRFLPLYDSITTKGGRTAVIDYYPILYRIINYHDELRYSRLALYHYSKGNTEESIEYIGKTLKLDSWHCFANWVAGLVCMQRGETSAALRHFDICIIVEPKWAEPYYFKSMILCDNHELDNAIKCLRKALYLAQTYFKNRLSKRIVNMQIAYCNLRGMLHWQNGKIESAYRYFIKTVKVIDANKRRNCREMRVLPQILKIDRKICTFSKATNLLSLEKLVKRTCIVYADMFGGSMKYLEPGYQYRDFVSVKHSSICSLLSALDSSFRKRYVSELKHADSEYNLKVIENDFDEFILITRFLRLTEEQLGSMGFVKGVQAINSLKNFILEIRNDLKTYTSIEKIPSQKQVQLIRSLALFASVIDGETTRFHSTQLLTKNVFHKEMMAFKSDFLAEARKYTDDVKIEFREMFEAKVISTKEKLEVSKLKEEKKIRILTNVDEHGNVCDKILLKEISEEKLQKIDKNNYLIWLDCKTGMCFVYGKQFARASKGKGSIDPVTKNPAEKRKPTTVGKKFRRWIFYLIENNGKKAYYSYLYKVYSGHEYGTVEYKRRFITKLRLVLLDYSNDALKNYIIYTPGVELGLDIKNEAVCVVHIDRATSDP